MGEKQTFDYLDLNARKEPQIKTVRRELQQLQFCHIESQIFLRRKWQTTPVFLPGESHGQRSLVGYSPRGRKELDMTERLHFHFHPSAEKTFSSCVCC